MMVVNRMTGLSSGMVMEKNWREAEAPSMRAAS